MALSDVDLCGAALIRLGARPLESMEDDTAEGVLAAALYGPVRDALLSANLWSFATAQAALAEAAGATPLDGYAYVYDLPEDYLRAVSAGAAGRKGRGAAYRIAGGRLHSNTGGAVLTYIYRPDEGGVPPYFDAALIARLAAEFCIPVTENTSRSEMLFRQAEAELARARQIDAQQDTTARLDSFPLIDVRG